MTDEAVTRDRWEADSSKLVPNLQGIQSTVITRGELGMYYNLLVDVSKDYTSYSISINLKIDGEKPRMCFRGDLSLKFNIYCDITCQQKLWKTRFGRFYKNNTEIILQGNTFLSSRKQWTLQTSEWWCITAGHHVDTISRVSFSET